jgi:outer membrane receptor protein involved in Fe transport
VSINDYSGNRLVVSPEFSFSGGVYYDWEVSGVGTLTPRFEARFKDKTFTTPQNSNNPIVGDNERWLFDARLDYRGPTGVVTLALWVRNLTNEIYRNAVVGGTRSRRMVVAIADPRTYGISASMSF